MICPHCLVAIHANWELLIRQSPNPSLDSPGEEGSVRVFLQATKCPECHRLVVQMQRSEVVDGDRTHTAHTVYPLGARRPIDPSVEEPFRTDYQEAAAILELSGQGSAAISRRIVQTLLRDRGGYSQHHLADQIHAFAEDAKNPSALRENLHYLREIGNFAAHPMKSSSTGTVMPVEPGEAEWALEVVDGLFDYYFVGPARDAARRAAFNQRLNEAGRRPLIE